MTHNLDQTPTDNSNLESEEKTSYLAADNKNANSVYPAQYHVPNRQYVYPSNMIQANYPVVFNNQPIIVTDNSIMRISQTSNYQLCQPRINFKKIDETRINLAENYPTCYVVWHCSLLIFCALAQLASEYFLVEIQSPMSSMTSGYHSGAFTVAFSIFTLMTIGFRHPRLIRLVITFNVFLVFVNTGFGIVVSVFDLSESHICSDMFYIPSCYSEDVYYQIFYLNIVKLVAAIVSILSAILYITFVAMRMNRKNFTGTRYAYVNPNFFQPQSYQQQDN